MKRVLLIIEKSNDRFLGQVEYDSNLIIEEAENVNSFEEKIKQTLKDAHNIDPTLVIFQYKYDLTALFGVLSYLKISSVAKLSDMHPGLLRQYVSGVKFPSAAQVRKVETAIHKMSHELRNILINSRNQVIKKVGLVFAKQ